MIFEQLIWYNLIIFFLTFINYGTHFVYIYISWLFFWISCHLSVVWNWESLRNNIHIHVQYLLLVVNVSEFYFVLSVVWLLLMLLLLLLLLLLICFLFILGGGWVKGLITGADPEIFQVGGLRRKILKQKCLLIHLSTRVHIKTRQTCNSFSLLPFQEDCHIYFVLFYYSLLFLKLEKGREVATL